MAELPQLENALRNADAAGDTDAARMLAAEITRLRGSQPAAPQQGTWDKLTAGIPVINPDGNGPRYQTWPERAIREVAGVPQRAIEAAHSAPAGSREATENMIAPATDAAMVFTPQSRAAAIFGRAPSKVAAPTLEELEGAVNRGYASARQSGVTVPPEMIAGMRNKIGKELSEEGYLQATAPKTFAAVDAMRPPTPGPGETLGPIGIQNMEAMRRAFGKAGKDRSESDAARRAQGVLDDDLSALSPELKVARDNAAAKFRAEDSNIRITRADRQAGRNGSGANLDNVLRQRVSGKLDELEPTSLDMKRGKAGYTAEELQQMERVGQGTAGGNLARVLSKLSPQHPLTGWPASVAAGVTGTAMSGGNPVIGGVAAVAAPTIGMLAKALAERSTKNQANKLDEMIRRRSPLYQEKLENAPKEVPQSIDALIRALLADKLEQQQRMGGVPTPVGAGL